MKNSSGKDPAVDQFGAFHSNWGDFMSCLAMHRSGVGYHRCDTGIYRHQRCDVCIR